MTIALVVLVIMAIPLTFLEVKGAPVYLDRELFYRLTVFDSLLYLH